VKFKKQMAIGTCFSAVNGLDLWDLKRRVSRIGPIRAGAPELASAS
jgi:hypothetical protein